MSDTTAETPVSVDIRKCPKLRPDVRDSIERYLIAKLEAAEDAKAKAIESAARLVCHMDLHKNIDYWTHAVATIKWLLAQLEYRQRYLVILDPEGKDWK
jgi:hypothetical protein